MVKKDHVIGTEAHCLSDKVQLQIRNLVITTLYMYGEISQEESKCHLAKLLEVELGTSEGQDKDIEIVAPILWISNVVDALWALTTALSVQGGSPVPLGAGLFLADIKEVVVEVDQKGKWCTLPAQMTVKSPA